MAMQSFTCTKSLLLGPYVGGEHMAHFSRCVSGYSKNGTGDGIRTRKPVKAGDFLTTTVFTASRNCLGSGLSLHLRHYTLRRRPSSLYTFNSISAKASLGIAI
jgi:hypothetical protein